MSSWNIPMLSLILIVIKINCFTILYQNISISKSIPKIPNEIIAGVTPRKIPIKTEKATLYLVTS